MTKFNLCPNHKSFDLDLKDVLSSNLRCSSMTRFGNRVSRDVAHFQMVYQFIAVHQSNTIYTS